MDELHKLLAGACTAEALAIAWLAARLYTGPREHAQEVSGLNQRLLDQVDERRAEEQKRRLEAEAAGRITADLIKELHGAREDLATLLQEREEERRERR